MALRAKEELVSRIMERFGLSRQIAMHIVMDVLDDLSELIVTEGRVELRNFGVFEVVERKAHMYRNPKNNVPAPVPARKNIKFWPGKALLKAVRQADEVVQNAS